MQFGSNGIKDVASHAYRDVAFFKNSVRTDGGVQRHFLDFLKFCVSACSRKLSFFSVYDILIGMDYHG